MRTPASQLPIVPELERAFEHVNKRLFEETLDLPTFVIHTEKKCILRFVPHTFSFIIGQGLATATLREIEESLLHEMIHVRNFMEKEVDCTSNQYHNKTFRTVANAVGFYVIRHKTQGWGTASFSPPKTETLSYTKPDPGTVARRRSAFNSLKFDDKILEETQKEMKMLLAKQSSRKVCFLKYVCGCPKPHNSIRSGRRPDGPNPLNITCNNCGKDFRLARGQI